VNGAIMEARKPLMRDVVDSRVRRTVTTLLLIVLALMVVRDILIRRWGGPNAAAGVTYRASCDSEGLRRPPAPSRCLKSRS
jgi:hypothetical protein